VTQVHIVELVTILPDRTAAAAATTAPGDGAILSLYPPPAGL